MIPDRYEIEFQFQANRPDQESARVLKHWQYSRPPARSLVSYAGLRFARHQAWPESTQKVSRVR